MRTRQQGVAVVLAMSVVALAALAATTMMVSQSTWARKVELATAHSQAEHLVQAGLDWARDVLRDDRLASNVDTLDQPWALRLPPIPVDNGSLAGHIEDEQGKFNLNNLMKNGQLDVVQLAHFRRLLSILQLSPALADALAGWMGAVGEPQAQGGTEDAYYLALRPPYLAANRPMTDMAELALVRGFDANVRERLRPFVTALPRFTTINVNTASPEVISAVVDGMSLDDARAIVAQRERNSFRSLSDFLSQVPRGIVVSNDNISVGSDYFVATMEVNLDDAQARGSVLLARESASWPAIIWRKYQ